MLCPMLCRMMVSMIEERLHSLRAMLRLNGTASRSRAKTSKRATVRFLLVQRLRKDGTAVPDGPCDAAVIVPVGGRVTKP